MMLIDESSLLSKKIDKLYLKNSAFSELPKPIYHRARKYLLYENLEGLDKFLVDMLESLSLIVSMDERIKEVLSYIDSLKNLDGDLFEEMARKSYLSESRFSHLFKAEVGVDFKKYLLLKRMKETLSYVLIENMSITNACIESGFSSPSHFASACKNHFGLSLSDFVKSQNKK